MAACVGASFILSSSAGPRAWSALKRAGNACAWAVGARHEPLRLDDADGYAALAARFDAIAQDEATDLDTCLGAAEVAWAANALARSNLVGDGFDTAFFELLALADAWPDEPAFVALAATALRDHRAAVVPSDPIQNRADEALVEALAQAHARHDPDNGAVPALLALAALDAGHTTEAADQLSRAARAVTIDEYPVRRLLAAERVLMDAGADELGAREFLVRRAFTRAGARAGEFVQTLGERLAAVVADDASTGLALRRVAERVAASTLMRADAQLAAEVAQATRTDGVVDGRRANEGRESADTRRWLERSEVAGPLRGVHDLVLLCAVGFALLAAAIRTRARVVLDPAQGARAIRGAGAPAPVVAMIFALAAPLAALVFLAVTRTWPFWRSESFLDVLCMPHPALLALPLASLPFILGGSIGKSTASGGTWLAVRRMSWTLAFTYALGFAWTSSAVDAVEGQRARALVELMQFDPASASAE